MSDMEYNKGKLIPTGIDTELFDDDAFDDYWDSGYVVINNEIYSVKFEVERGELYEIDRAHMNEDGSIDFETWHYNGGGHWTEVVANALDKQ